MKDFSNKVFKIEEFNSIKLYLQSVSYEFLTLNNPFFFFTTPNFLFLWLMLSLSKIFQLSIKEVRDFCLGWTNNVDLFSCLIFITSFGVDQNDIHVFRSMGARSVSKSII